jgi:iron complex outermembrane recepter protein
MHAHKQVKQALTVSGIGSLLLMLSLRPALAQQKEDVVELSAFRVSGASDEGYRAVDSVGGTRFRVPLKEIPLPVQIVTQELMEDTVSYTVADAIQYAASVRQAGSSTNDLKEEFSIRGFVASFNLRNGFRVKGVTDTANISHIEVIKGPSSVLYGAAEPGGLLNFNTKRPLFVAGGSASYTYGTNSFNRGMVDVYGPLGKSETMAFRFISTYTNAKSDTFWALEKTFLAPSFEWRINKTMRFGVELEYMNLNQDGLRKRGMVGVITGITVPGYVRPQAVWDREIGPDFDIQRNAFKDGEQRFWVTDFDWNVTDWITFRVAYQDASAETRIYKIDGAENPFSSGGNLPVRGPRRQIEEVNGYGYKADLLFDLSLGKLGYHKLLFGYELHRERFKEDTRQWRNGTLARIGLGPNEIKNLAAVRAATDNFTSTTKLWGGTWDQIDRFFNVSRTAAQEKLNSIFLTDKVTLMDEQLHILGGVRYDEVDSVNQNLQNGTRSPAPGAKETTFQLGGVYNLTDSLGLFANYSDSFQPNGFGAQGEALPPQSGEGIDFGLKFGGKILGKPISGNIAYFDIIRENIPRTITLAPDFLEKVTLLSGKERTEGIDFDMVIDLADKWQLLLAGAYMDGRVVKNSEDPLLEGKQNVETPRRQFRIFTRYSFMDGPLAGWTFGGGMHYEDSAPTENRSDRFLRRSDAHAIIDVFASYRLKLQGHDAAIQLNIDNLLDKEYIVRSQQWADPREYRLSFKYQF